MTEPNIAHEHLARLDESVDKLFNAMKARVPENDMARICDAYTFAVNAHQGQKRKTGEPYIIHPVNVALIVAEELELGANPVIAALLHDVAEDTPYSIDDIRSRFGDDVAFLVGVVTKQKKDKYEHSKQVDNYRQILASVKYDIRALLIKLADRLHNMRTLESMSPDKQMKIAGETDYFYAPLANRLGLYHIKTELENLSFRYRCPLKYQEIERLINEEKDRPGIMAFTENISSLLRHHGIVCRLETRYRTPCSIWRKMQSAGCDFNHVDGKEYIRIIYTAYEGNEKETSLRIYSILSDSFKERPGSVSNYINAPKENGYQSFHVKLLSCQGHWEEIHISSERMVRNSRLGCAAERSESNITHWLDKFKSVLKDMAYHEHGIDFMEGVTSSFYNDDIMVFTPKGMGVILPKDATALDFAFEIHSKIGLHAVYARINGKLSPVTARLHRGDCVEIGTDEDSTPDAGWIRNVCTYRAKKGLRSIIARKPETDFHRCPCCHPLPGDEVIGFKRADGSTILHKRNCPEAIRMASEQGDSIISVNFEENTGILYPVRIKIRGVDRYHLLSDLVGCISEKLRLSMSRLSTETSDRIAECTIDFSVHSAAELHSVMEMISAIPGVDEVSPIDIG